MKRFLFPFSFVFIYVQGINQVQCNRGKQFLIWNENIRLSVSDFKGDKIEYSSFAAETFVGIKFGYAFEDTLMYDVVCYVDKRKSWALENSEYVLNHEQGHFNIGEIYARKLRKRVQEIRTKINRYNTKILDSTYYIIGKDMIVEQKKYDEETTFPGRNRDMQDKWNQLISEKLDSLNEFHRIINKRIELKFK